MNQNISWTKNKWTHQRSCGWVGGSKTTPQLWDGGARRSKKGAAEGTHRERQPASRRERAAIVRERAREKDERVGRERRSKTERRRWEREQNGEIERDKEEQWVREKRNGRIVGEEGRGRGKKKMGGTYSGSHHLRCWWSKLLFLFYFLLSLCILL